MTTDTPSRLKSAVDAAAQGLQFFRCHTGLSQLFIICASLFFRTRLVVSLFKKVGIDIRRLWNLTRLYNQTWMAMEGRNSAKSLKRWYLLNRPGYGIAWGCAMESTYRIFAICYIMSCNKADEEFVAYLKEKLKVELDFVQNNLEISSRNNHYFFNILGLISAYCVLGDAKRKEDLYSVADSLLDYQFNRDGTNFEASTAYHLLVLEAIAATCLVDAGFDAHIRLKHFDKINAAVGFAGNLFVSEDAILLVGDNDGSTVFLGLGNKHSRQFQRRLIASWWGVMTQPTALISYPDFGLCRAQSGEAVVFLSAGPNGQNGKGGHAHNDKLGVCLFVKGTPVLVDPGTLSYTKMRNSFRSAQGHSVPMIGGIEPNPFDKNVFALADYTKAKIDSISSAGGAISIVASHQGYVSSIGVKLHRSVELQLGKVSVKDFTSGVPVKAISLITTWIFAPEVSVTKNSISTYLLSSESFEGELSLGDVASVELVPQLISNDYGSFRATDALIAKWASNQAMEWTIKWKC
jgi:hypothetical protein